MLRMLGLPTIVVLRGLFGALDGAKHVAKPGDQTDHEEREHQPWRRAGFAVEPHAEQQADDHRDAELEPDRARRELVERAAAALRGGIDELAHGLWMQLLHRETLRHFAAM